MEKNAVFIGEKWLPYRSTTTERFFTVHSVFNRVINISADCGLLSVVSEDIGGSSTYLTVSGKLVNFGVNAGEPCTVREGCIRFTGQTINFKGAPLWKGKIHKDYKNKKIKSENITAFKAMLDRKAPPQSAWRYVNSNYENRYSGLKAILNLRENPFLAQNMIGLGQGLTPAGDDMLLGFMAMVNHVSENRAFVSNLHNAVFGSLHKTVDISAQSLENALDCDYHEYIQNCIRDLCEGEKEEVYISAASLLSMGATSGSDIACGMYFGMNNERGGS
jgi:hypothetical protein